MKVDVSDPRPGGSMGRLVLALLGEQGVEVERQRRHLDLSVDATPFLARAVAVYLDPVALGVREVERLADEVVRGPGERATGADDAAQGAREVRPARHQDREVEEARGAPSPGWRVRIPSQLDHGRVVGPEAERRAVVALVVEDPQADRALVELALPIEVRDGEAHGAHMRLQRDGHGPKPSSRSFRVRPGRVACAPLLRFISSNGAWQAVRFGIKGSASTCR